MTNNTAADIAALVRNFTGDNWYELWERSHNLSPHEQEQLLHNLVAELRFADEEKQTRILDLMLEIDRAKARPLIENIVQNIGSSLIKQHICWRLEGWADDAWLPLFSRLLLNDSDVEVRLGAAITLSFIYHPQAIAALQYARDHDNVEHNGLRVSDVARQLLDDMQG